MITKAVHPDVFKDMPTLQRMYEKMENINEEISEKDNEIMKLRKKLKENNIEVD
jgi:predicted RNase H-like nuclease (RuvC/YqgF family)